MPYPKRLLNEGEEVALDLKPHWWFFSKQIIAGTALLVLFVLVIGVDNEFTWWAWAILALVYAGWLGLVYLDWYFTNFVVTSNRVVYRTGVLSKRGVEIPLGRVNNINFNQSIWERVIGAGDLEIESAGESGQSLFEDVRHPDGVQQEIYRQMESNAKRQASWSGGGAVVPPATSAAAASIPDQIQQLAELRDRGVISAAEFEAKKAQLLERM